MSFWLVWIILGVVFLVLEILTPTFFFISFGVACITTGFAAIFIKNLFWQLILFSAVCLVVFFLLRRFSSKYFTSEKNLTNVYSLVGKSGIVQEQISAYKVGKIKINGEVWSASSEQTLEKNELAQVESLSGNRVIVKKLKEG